MTPPGRRCWRGLCLRTTSGGAYFAREGRVERRVGLLTEGVARAFFRSPDGTEYNKFFYVPVMFIGAYSSLVTGQTNTINIQCLTDCQLLETSYAEFSALYPSYPQVETLSRKLSETYFVAKENREIAFIVSDARERYRQFRLAYPGLEQHVAQYHIASHLGISPTHLSRIRAQLGRR